MTADRCETCGSEYADPNRDVCLDCEDYDMTYGADAQRIVAALAATRHFTLDGLEQIVVKDWALDLALRASVMVQERGGGIRIVDDDDSIRAQREAGIRSLRVGLMRAGFPPADADSIAADLIRERATYTDAELTERVRAVTPVDALPGLLANPIVPGAK